MSWLIIIISSYFLFALAALGDKYLLLGPPNSKIYSFYVGILQILVLVFIPFVGFSIPGLLPLLFCLLAGAMYIFALLGLFEGLKHFEASRIIPAIGGFLPLFTFGLIYLFSGGKEILEIKGMLSLIVLVLGSIFISYNPEKKVSFKSLQISTITAFLFSLAFVLTKYVYLMLPFWTGFIWIRTGTFLIALFFIFFREVRKEIFSGVFAFNKKDTAFFLFTQGMGAGASILQNWAVALAGLAYLSIINALQGLQYAFLFILAILIASKFPKILEEEISKRVIFQKVFSILLMGLGLIFLAFR